MNKLIKSSLLILALILVSTILAINIAQAQETIPTEEVALDETVTPSDLNVTLPVSGPFSFLKNVANGLQYALTFNPVAKAEIKLKQANEALLMAQQALQNNPEDFKAKEMYDSYLEKYTKRMEQLQQKVETFKDKAQNNPKIDQFLNKLTDNSLKQQRLMDHVSGLLTDEQRANLQDKRETSIKTLSEALKNLDDANNLPARLDNIMNQQTGSPLIHLKNLDVLQNLKDRLPAEALKGIQNAEENVVKRLNAAVNNIEPGLRKEKIQNYFTNSNGDPITEIQTMETLSEDPTLPQELKAAIPGIQNMKTEAIDAMINGFKNDEHKVRNLERIRQIENPQTKTLLREIEQKYVDPSAPANTPLKADNLKAGVRANLKEGTKPARQQGDVTKDKDLRDRIKDEPVQSQRDTVKDAVREGVKSDTKPVRMQEKVEGGLDKVKDVANQNQQEPATETNE